MVDLPESCYVVWKWFIDLHNARTSNGFGINPITYTEIKCYFDLVEVRPDSWELELIRRFDSIALEAFGKQTELEKKKQQQKK